MEVKGFKQTALGMLAVYAASEEDAWAVRHERGLFWVGKIVGKRGRRIRLQWYMLDPSMGSATLTRQQDWLGSNGFCGCTDLTAEDSGVCECYLAIVKGFLVI